MRRKLLSSAMLLFSTAGILGAADVWELRDDRWVQVTTAPAAEAASVPELDEAADLIGAGQSHAGARIAIRYVKAHPDLKAPQRDRALMLASDGKYAAGRLMDAYFYTEQLLDQHPDTPLFQQALQRQYDIADAFLNGTRRVFILFATISAEDEAIDMLYRIQQRAPGSQIAEKSLLRTADHYYARSRFDLAADAYRVYLTGYPRSPHIPQVRLRRAYATLAQFRGTRYDATPLIDAQTQMIEIVDAYPQIADDQGLSDLLKRIDQTFAQKLMRHAEWYERTHQPAAAVYVYRYLASTFATTPEAATARRRLEGFSAELLKAPPPRPGRGYAPMAHPYPEEL